MNSIRGQLKPSAKLAFLAGSLAALLFGVLGMLAMIPVVSPTTGAEAADLLRSILGPRPVAFLEGGSLEIQDAFNRLASTWNGGQKTISLTRNGDGLFAIGTQGKAGTGTAKQASMLAGNNAVSADPQIGWQPYGPLVNGSPVMAQTMLTLDPQRPYAGVALVRIDLSKLKLHMVPGVSEPSHAPDVVSALPGMGLTPAADQLRLVAGFNGGFKAVNGHYGMMVNGVTLLPPQPGLATIAIYKDGHVAMGAWGQDILPSPDIVAFRQNCPPIIENGGINPQVSVENQAIWGDTVGNKAITWRTGIGLTQDGRYLIYAVGNATTVETLATALRQAGAYNAMQLDINRPFARFVTYQTNGSSTAPLKAVPLLNQMENEPSLYLVPHSRDYFYLTTQ